VASVQNVRMNFRMNRLNTSHSQRLNSGKPLGIGRFNWLCPIEPCPNETLSYLIPRWLCESVEGKYNMVYQYSISTAAVEMRIF